MTHDFGYEGKPERKMIRAKCDCGWSAFGLTATVEQAREQWQKHARDHGR